MSTVVKIGVGCFVGLVVIVVTAMAAYPQYRVYSQRLAGEARLREAESSRKIAIEEAKAKLESAKSLALAEVERAKGVAEANQIIGESLKENEAYLRYLWIQGLQDGSSEVIYVPTEANLPILEAGRKIKLPAAQD
jgi:regulator of protease activity HflC (stomatin/prohibitin superfamily)